MDVLEAANRVLLNIREQVVTLGLGDEIVICEYADPQARPDNELVGWKVVRGQIVFRWHGLWRISDLDNEVKVEVMNGDRLIVQLCCKIHDDGSTTWSYDVWSSTPPAYTGFSARAKFLVGPTVDHAEGLNYVKDLIQAFINHTR